MTSRALVVGHDHVAGLGLLEPALAGRGVGIDRFRVVPPERFDAPDVDVVFPDPLGWDLVVTLGAPWPRDRIRGWAATETAFLRRAHHGGVPVLAICFGAQLLAEALGGWLALGAPAGLDTAALRSATDHHAPRAAADADRLLHGVTGG